MIMTISGDQVYIGGYIHLMGGLLASISGEVNWALLNTGHTRVTFLETYGDHVYGIMCVYRPGNQYRYRLCLEEWNHRVAEIAEH